MATTNYPPSYVDGNGHLEPSNLVDSVFGEYSYSTRMGIILTNEARKSPVESGITILHAIITNVSKSSSRFPQAKSHSFDQYPSNSGTFTSADGNDCDGLTAEQRSTFLLDCLTRALDTGQKKTELLLFLPSRSGHLVRSDILEIRLADCPVIEGYINLAGPTTSFNEEDIVCLLNAFLLEDMLKKCIGACRVSMGVAGGVMLTLAQELSTRLSIPIMQEGVRHHRTLAILECGRSPASGLGLFNAAKALNIGVVALDKPGHWMSKDEYASWRDAFIPIDRTPDDGLPGRIVAALNEYGKQVDGIISFFDPLLPATAAAAAMLKLPTAPVEVYNIATDKQRTSEFDGRPAYRVSSLAGALEVVRRELVPPSSCGHAVGRSGALSYPLIVKPCAGWGSEGVFRADNETDFVRAVNSIDFGRHGSDFVIENYCDGPEVDANFVLCDGQLLFFEASDDFPKDADLSATDADGGNTQHTFIEVANVLPSALPQDEQKVLRESLHRGLLRLGFSSGLYHLEARLQNSRMEYGRNEDGVLELKPKNVVNHSVQGPSAWLIEINARPPGLQASWASRNTYGVDFWGLSLSFALNEKETARALAVPFGTETGNQYWCQIVFIPVAKGGVFESDDVCQELMQRRPDLAKHISRSLCFFERGQNVPDPSEGLLTWVAYYLVFSRESRQDVLKVADAVRRETVFTIS